MAEACEPKRKFRAAGPGFCPNRTGNLIGIRLLRNGQLKRDVRQKARQRAWDLKTNDEVETTP
jgi:hypothetical protein